MGKIKLILLLTALLLLQACVENYPIEETAIINSRGIDIIGEENGNSILETTIIPYIFDPNAQDTSKALIGQGYTVKEARESADAKSSFRLSPGKISIEFYGKEAAESGLLPLLNTLIRDARVSDRMQLAITNQTAKEVLITEQEAIAVNTVDYMQDLINKEVEQHTLPKNTLEYFSRLTEQIGIDAVLPIIDVIEGVPQLTGAGLFDRDKYVDQVSMSEATLINQMRRNISGAPIDAEIPAEEYQHLISNLGGSRESGIEKIYLSLANTVGKAKVKIMDQNAVAFKATIKMEAELLETSVPMEIKTKKVSEQVEKNLETYFENEYKKLFEKLKEAGSDAFGLGRIYVATRNGSDTTEEEWKKMYQDATIEFDVDFTLNNYGTID